MVNCIYERYKMQNDKIYFEFKGLDIYKRVLAVIYFDDINVNDSMKTFGGCSAY